ARSRSDERGESMKCIRVDAYGGPEAMKLVEVAQPPMGPGDARVKVEAAGVNFIDVYHRTGLYKSELPVHLGLEGTGVVMDAGPEAGLRAGDRVAWAGVTGSYATEVVARAAVLVPIPDGLGSREAAAAMLQGMTAHYLARSTRRLGPEDVCVIHAAAGG